jgi:biotin transport system substrate-specific component
VKTNTKKLVQAALLAALTAVGAFLRFPLGALSFTMQDMFTVMAGVLLGWKWGMASQAAYVALGLIGLPIFTQGGGLGYVFQPSFGFLLGLIPAAALTGALAGEKGDPRRVVPACIAGLAMMYLIGVPYMGMILNVYMGKGLSVWTIVKTGLLVYLPGDALKVAVVTGVAPALCRNLKRMEA